MDKTIYFTIVMSRYNDVPVAGPRFLGRQKPVGPARLATNVVRTHGCFNRESKRFANDFESDCQSYPKTTTTTGKRVVFLADLQGKYRCPYTGTVPDIVEKR